jgi:hypothetical protein
VEQRNFDRHHAMAITSNFQSFTGNVGVDREYFGAIWIAKANTEGDILLGSKSLEMDINPQGFPVPNVLSLVEDYLSDSSS